MDGPGGTPRVAVVSRWRTWRVTAAPARRRSGVATVSFARLAGGAGAFPGAASGREGRRVQRRSSPRTPVAGPSRPAAVRVLGYALPWVLGVREPALSPGWSSGVGTRHRCFPALLGGELWKDGLESWPLLGLEGSLCPR